MTDVVVLDNPQASRFEAFIDGELAGFVDYALRPDSIVFIHTEVDDKFEGRGVGSSLVKQTLAKVREDGELDVIPECPFYRSYLTKHPEYDDLLNPAWLEKLAADR
jgi:predicted GNAT family acetyltransferase